MIVGRNPDGSYRYSTGTGLDRTFDELADAIEANADAVVINSHLERAKSEYARRQEACLSYSPNPGLSERISLSMIRSSVYGGFRPTPLGCVTTFICIGIGAFFGRIGVFVAIAFIAVVGLSFESSRNARRNRVRRQLESTNCRKCGYELANLPSVVSKETEGVDFGPRVCPECGEAWPRVPPLLGP